MKKVHMAMATLLISTALLGACTNRQLATAGGAGVGGVVGNVATGGSVGGTVVGAAGGGLLGYTLAH